MSICSQLLQARKKKGISQEDIARQLGTKGTAIDRYEQDEMKLSIEAVIKMANIIEASLDWLVGITDSELDTTTLNPIKDISKFSQKIRNSSLSSLIPLSPIGKLKYITINRSGNGFNKC